MRRSSVTVFAILALTLIGADPAYAGNGAFDTSAVAHGHLLQAAKVFDTNRQMRKYAKKLRKIERRRAILRAKRRAALARKRAAEAAQAAAQAATPTSVSSGGAVSNSTLAAIANCESHGDPGAVSSTGKYRGLFQFDYHTWQTVGGRGDPAAAPVQEQYDRAAALYARAGSSPWPVCGR